MILVLITIIFCGQVFAVPVSGDARSWWDPEGDRENDALDEFFRNVIQDFISYMGLGFPSLGIPPLDPFLNADQWDHLTDHLMDVNVETYSVLSEGYSYFNVTSADTNMEIERLTINMTVPSLYIWGEYSLDGTYYGMFPVYGRGPFEITIFSISAAGAARLHLQDGGVTRMKCKTITMSNMTLEPIQFAAMSPDFRNLMVSVPGGGDHVRSQVGRKVYQNVESEVRKELTTAIETYLNERLETGAVPPS